MSIYLAFCGQASTYPDPKEALHFHRMCIGKVEQLAGYWLICDCPCHSVPVLAADVKPEPDL